MQHTCGGAPPVDDSLLPYLNAADEDEAGRQQELLIVGRAGPLIRRILRHRLGLCLDESGSNLERPDAEDVYSNVITAVLKRLGELRAAPHGPIINNFDSYVARMAHNMCYDMLRKRYPARLRLKNQLERLLERHSDFALWRNEEAELLCGLAAWEGARPALRHALDSPAELSVMRASLGDVDVHDDAQLPRLLSAVFGAAGAPLGTDHLVALVAQFRGVKSQSVESLDDQESPLREGLADASLGANSLLEMRQALAHVWEEICRLPVQQRNAFLLGCRDHNGEDVITLLLVSQVATLDRIARELGLSAEHLAALWRRMPLDNATIALEMGATRQQVNKWRWKANEQLRKRFL
jgi:RNA polymerase sigma factor (sigma-70 family)